MNMLYFHKLVLLNKIFCLNSEINLYVIIPFQLRTCLVWCENEV